MKILRISFSGGRTSAFMTQFIMEYPKYKDVKKVVLYANTGKELPETLDFIDKCDKYFGWNVVWIEPVIHPDKQKGTTHKVVDYETACRDGRLFQQMIDKYTMPNKSFPHCTRELKIRPLHSYMRQNYGVDYHTAIGIRADELNRVNRSKKGYIYPLVDDIRVDNAFIRRYWDRQPFDLGIKDYEGNCDFCWKKSRRKRMTLLTEGMDVLDWVKWEGQSEYHFDRDDISIEELIEKAKQPFNKYQDKYLISKEQGSLFDNDMDKEYDCFCKST